MPRWRSSLWPRGPSSFCKKFSYCVLFSNIAGVIADAPAMSVVNIGFLNYCSSSQSATRRPPPSQEKSISTGAKVKYFFRTAKFMWLRPLCWYETGRFGDEKPHFVAKFRLEMFFRGNQMSYPSPKNGVLQAVFGRRTPLF